LINKKIALGFATEREGQSESEKYNFPEEDENLA